MSVHFLCVFSIFPGFCGTGKKSRGYFVKKARIWSNSKIVFTSLHSIRYAVKRITRELTPSVSERGLSMIALPKNFETYPEARKAGFLRMKALKD